MSETPDDHETPDDEQEQPELWDSGRGEWGQL
jgi:hypothetical protein